MRPITRCLLGLTITLIPAAVHRAASVWTAPAGESRVGFLLHTSWHGVEGTTTAVDALLESAGGDPLSDGLVRVTVEAATLDSGVARRDRKMREEHLETATYPLMVFRSTAPPSPLGSADSEAVAADGRFVEVTGDLTIHGVTRQVTVPVEARALADGWLMKAGFSLRLSDYGVPVPSIILNKVRDEVDVYLEIRFAPPGARAAVSARRGSAGDRAVTLFLVRHAEKGAGDPRDPHLADAGRRRAEALARMLSGIRVTHLFATEFHRTRETLAPLVSRTGVEVTVIPGRDLQRQVEELRRLDPGSVAVVAGHADTVPWMVLALGGEVADLIPTEHGGMLGEEEYDRLFVVILPGGGGRPLKTLDLRYGEPGASSGPAP